MFLLVLGAVIIYSLLPEKLSSGFAYVAILGLTLLSLYSQRKKEKVPTIISGDFIIHYNTMFPATGSKIVKNGRLVSSKKDENRLLLYIDETFRNSILKKTIREITDMEGKPLVDIL
ncbi:MAG: hypothetical protein PHT84_00950 [Candidatus Pacebacteria bacterium]|nr:hypothetical protein [Candidatus Paceibacterota bacterium]